MRAVDDGQQRIRRGLAPLGGDVALRVDGARAALQDDLAAADLLGQAVPVGVARAVGQQDRRAQRVPVPALDQEADDAGPLRLPGFVERVWRPVPGGRDHLDPTRNRQLDLARLVIASRNPSSSPSRCAMRSRRPAMSLLMARWPGTMRAAKPMVAMMIAIGVSVVSSDNTE